MTNTNLWWATKRTKVTPETQQRASRLLAYLEETTPPVMYKDIRRDLGLSYWQTVIAIGILCNADLVHVSVTAEWNGQHYVYPHRVWLKKPPSL